MINDKKVLYSAMQSTGTLTLGNYLGALNNWVKLSDEFETFYAIADLHSLTVRQNPADLRKAAKDLYTLYVAAGLDPEKNCIYYQYFAMIYAAIRACSHSYRAFISLPFCGCCACGTVCLGHKKGGIFVDPALVSLSLNYIAWGITSVLFHAEC